MLASCGMVNILYLSILHLNDFKPDMLNKTLELVLDLERYIKIQNIVHENAILDVYSQGLWWRCHHGDIIVPHT